MAVNWKRGDQGLREILYSEGGEALAQVAQRSCGCPIPGDVQCLFGRGSGQSDLVLDLAVGNPSCGMGLDPDDL